MSSLKVKTTAIGSEADPQRPNKKSLPVLTSISSTPQERQLVRPKSSEWAPPTAHQSHRKKRSESGSEDPISVRSVRFASDRSGLVGFGQEPRT